MTPEEYQRLKEAEKEHLRKLKQLKEAVHLLERRKAVNQALENMVGGPTETRDVHDEMVEKLALETALQEARLEIALENADLDAPLSTGADTETTSARTTEASEEASEEALLKARAKSLLQQIKLEMGASAAEASPPPKARTARSQETAPSPDPTGLPEKTIGRMK